MKQNFMSNSFPFITSYAYIACHILPIISLEHCKDLHNSYTLVYSTTIWQKKSAGIVQIHSSIIVLRKSEWFIPLVCGI